MIVDLQYGSTGKGLIAGYLGHYGNYDMVVNANMPNAGHTYIDAHGGKMMHKVLPNGLVGKSVKSAMIGPGAVFDPLTLRLEIENLHQLGYDQFHVFVHEQATVLLKAHKEAEQGDERLTNIGSTRQGSSAAMIHKIMRNPIRNPTVGAMLQNAPFMTILTQAQWIEKIHAADEILLEGAQGYSLGINAGFYPHCTSRDCTPARFMADCGIPHNFVRRVIGTARLHPIRVAGDSGDHYPDQRETSWAELGQEDEYTTVTQKVRRVFTWSEMQITEAIMACMPAHIFLNFCNYDPDLVSKIETSIQKAGMKAGYAPVVMYTGWGPTLNDVDARELDPCDMTQPEIKRGNA